MSVIGLCTVICGFLIPAWSDRIGRKPVMVIFCFMGMITPLAALFFDGPMWMLGALLFIGWSGTGAFPLFMGVIPGESVSPALAASSMGLVVAIGELIGGVGAPSVTGWFADQTSLQAPVYAIAILAFIAGVLSLFLTETAPRKTGAALAQQS
jgi:MFS family permease